MQNLILTPLPVNELVTLISSEIVRNINTLQNETKTPLDTKEEYYTRKEVCSLFHISLVTLNKHTKTKRLNAHRIGARVLYKKSEILKALSNF